MKNEIMKRLSRALFCLNHISVEGRQSIDNTKEVFDRLEEVVAILNECDIISKEESAETKNIK